MHRREVLAAGGETLADTAHLVLAMVTVALMFAAMAFGAAAFGLGFTRISRLPAVTSPTQVSWWRRLSQAEASDAR
jgi:hypothetical protein